MKKDVINSGRFKKGESTGRPKGAKNINSSRYSEMRNAAFGNENKKGVYFIRCGDSKFYKIGRTRNLAGRLYDIQVIVPYNIHLCKFIECEHYDKLEKTLHRSLDIYKHRGEWFILTDAVFSLLMTVNTIEDAMNLPEKLKPNLFTVLN